MVNVQCNFFYYSMSNVQCSLFTFQGLMSIVQYLLYVYMTVYALRLFNFLLNFRFFCSIHSFSSSYNSKLQDFLGMEVFETEINGKEQLGSFETPESPKVKKSKSLKVQKSKTLKVKKSNYTMVYSVINRCQSNIV